MNTGNSNTEKPLRKDAAYWKREFTRVSEGNAYSKRQNEWLHKQLAQSEQENERLRAEVTRFGQRFFRSFDLAHHLFIANVAMETELNRRNTEGIVSEVNSAKAAREK